ncbi:hypothetical protein EMCRGX_G003598 [Ephydatia muelleri]
MVFCTWLKSVFLDLPAISWLNKSAKIGRYVLWVFTLTALKSFCGNQMLQLHRRMLGDYEQGFVLYQDVVRVY